MFIFPVYRRLLGGHSVYGAVFGLILTMMFWFYLAAKFIIRAEINAYREGRHRHRSLQQRASNVVLAVEANHLGSRICGESQLLEQK